MYTLNPGLKPFLACDIIACVIYSEIGILSQGQDGLSLRKDAVLLVKNLTDAADALLNKAGNWGGKDRLSAVLKKIKKDVSKGLDWGGGGGRVFPSMLLAS